MQTDGQTGRHDEASTRFFAVLRKHLKTLHSSHGEFVSSVSSLRQTLIGMLNSINLLTPNVNYS